MPPHLLRPVIERSPYATPGRIASQQSDPIAVVVVSAVWAVMLIAGLGFVWKFASEFPYYDDFDVLPYLIGDKPITFSWLWSQHEEHRLFLPRLFMLAPVWLAGGDFRAGSFFSVLSMGLLAGAMILTARKQRGRISYADAFFPLILLPWQGIQGFHLWNFSMQFVLPALLAGTVLIIMVRDRAPLSLGQAIVAGLCISALPICGGTGLGLVPPLALWLCYVGILRWTSRLPHSKISGGAILGLAVLAILVAAFYWWGLRRTVPPIFNPKAIVWTAIQFLGNSAGMSAQAVWPVPVLVAVSFFVIGAFALSQRWYRSSRERYRTTGLLLFLLAFTCLAVGIGHARGTLELHAGLETRYIAAVVPMLCCVYYAFGISGCARRLSFRRLSVLPRSCSCHSI